MKDAHRKRWLYTARRVATQNNAGGGAIAVRLSVPAGVTASIQSGYVQGPVTNTTLACYTQDEDAALGESIFSVATGVSRETSLPATGAASPTHGSAASSVGTLYGPGTYIKFIAGASAQTETLTVYIVLLLSAPVEPTWDTTGSAGTVALAASTISAANTMQLVID